MIENLFKKVLKANHLVMSAYTQHPDEWERDIRDSNKALNYYYNGHKDLAEAISEGLLIKYEKYS